MTASCSGCTSTPSPSRPRSTSTGPGSTTSRSGPRDRDELEGWVKRLDDLGYAHGGIVDAHYGSGLSFRDPDGIALEFFAPPS